MDIQDFQFEQWLQYLPAPTESPYARYLPQIKAWRQTWVAAKSTRPEESNTLWQRFRRKKKTMRLKRIALT